MTAVRSMFFSAESEGIGTLGSLWTATNLSFAKRRSVTDSEQLLRFFFEKSTASFCGSNVHRISV